MSRPKRLTRPWNSYSQCVNWARRWHRQSFASEEWGTDDRYLVTYLGGRAQPRQEAPPAERKQAMTEYLGRGRLSEHDPDPEEQDHQIPPGQWVDATCQERDRLFFSTELTVWSGYTDIEGEYGTPAMFTEWGSPDGRTPVVADLRYLGGTPKPCEHKIYELEGSKP